MTKKDDHAPEDGAPPDLEPPELARPEPARPELARPELARPELGRAEPGSPDVGPLDPGPLDLGPLPTLLGYALRRAQMAVFADFHRVCEPLGLRPAQYSVLLMLRHNPGVRASGVADALGIQRTNFTTLLAAMEGAGLVERHADPRDRRAASLTLSAEGSALLARADRALVPHERRWRRRLGAAEYGRLLDLLGRVAEPG